MLKEIPCPQMTNSSISECVCEWCKSFKEEKLDEGGKEMSDKIISGKELAKICKKRTQESSPQKEVKEILNDINKAIKVWDNYQEAKVFHCPFNKDKCEEIKQAREEMQEEIKKFKQELITKYHTYGSIFADELDIFIKQPGEGEKK